MRTVTIKGSGFMLSDDSDTNAPFGYVFVLTDKQIVANNGFNNQQVKVDFTEDGKTFTELAREREARGESPSELWKECLDKLCDELKIERLDISLLCKTYPCFIDLIY